MNDDKRNILVSITFPENSSLRNDVNTETSIKNSIIKTLQYYKTENKIEHFVVAEDEVISEKLKSINDIGISDRSR